MAPSFTICSLKNISWAGITMLASQHSRDVHRNDIPPVFSLWAAEQWKGASRAAQYTTSPVLPGLWTTKQEDLRVGREVPRVHLVLPEDDALDVLHLCGLNPPLFLESCGEKPLGFGFCLLSSSTSTSSQGTGKFLFFQSERILQISR